MKICACCGAPAVLDADGTIVTSCVACGEASWLENRHPELELQVVPVESDSKSDFRPRKRK